jgi:hypothetical protein
MVSLKSMLLLTLLVNSTVVAQEATVTPLMSKDLPEFPGKEGLMISVVYPPGASDPIGLKIGLQDQPLQILVMLLERPGEVVTREQIQARLWPSGTFVEFEHRHPGVSTAGTPSSSLW